MKSYSVGDIFNLVVGTGVVGLMFAALVERGRIEPVILGLVAGICALTVQVRVLRRELREFKERVETPTK